MTNRQIAHFREELSRIIRNVELIHRENKSKALVVSVNTNMRLGIIEVAAREIDEAFKKHKTTP